MHLFRKRRIEELTLKLPREELLRRSRVLVVDDERPELIDDLKSARFAVDFEEDITKQNMHLIDGAIYDLIILDFGNVGTVFGSDQGLSLLKHIKRVNPSIVVFAYTSKALGTEHAEFYRLADGVLPKDAGIGESMEKIEDGLRKARSLQNLWAGMLHLAGITPGSKEDFDWQDLYVKGLTKHGKMQTLRQEVIRALGGEGGKAAGTVILEKLIEVGIKAFVGT
jgi:hypothetical protein